MPTPATDLHREPNFVAATRAYPPASHPQRRMTSGKMTTTDSAGMNNQSRNAATGATKGASAHRMTAMETRGLDGVFRGD